jgi:small-conductance mechanosensitive channel
MESLLARFKMLEVTEEGIYFLKNSLWDWLFAVIITIVVYFLLRPLFNLIVRKIDKKINHKQHKLGDIIINVLKNSKSWFFAIIAIFLGTKFLNLGEYNFIPHKILILTMLVQAAVWLSIIFSQSLKNWSEKNENPSKHSATVIVLWLGKFLIWSSAFLLLLDNLGVKIVSLLAGLGVGGIALALAMQKILGDVFASISIMLDKPFEIGDFIFIGDIKGTVESIGIKTTHLRSLTGEQVIIANSVLLDSRVSNFKRMSERRIVLDINVNPQNLEETLQEIIALVKDIIENQNDARFDRGHLKGFSASSIDYEFVYWVRSPDYVIYMDVQQKINMAILAAFAKRKINLAHQTQKVLLDKV